MRRRFAPYAAIITMVVAAAIVAAAPPAKAVKGGRASIAPEDLRAWLTYLASDELEGRNTFSEGLGLAAAYIAEHLREWGVKPGGDHGSYFQRVAVLGIKSTPHSTVTVEVAGKTRTFKDGEGIELPRNLGLPRSFSASEVEFLGYGLSLPPAGHDDYTGKDVKGKVVVWLGAAGPKTVEGRQYRRALTGRHRFATDFSQAVASIGPEIPPFQPQRGQEPGGQAQGRGGQPAGQPPAGPVGFGRGGAAAATVDFTTVQRLDRPLPPSVTAKDEFLDFLFSAAPATYEELKAKAAAREPLPSFKLASVKIMFDLDAAYETVRTQYTRNVVGVIDGADPKLKETFVAFGAHYDHVGYAEGRLGDGVTDRISNGADDDGSGTTTLLGVARAFGLGVKPKRSLMFIWHAGEERGLWGSRYYADYSSVAIERIVAQLNMDMVGRNRDDKTTEANTMYPVGSDRISTELHNILVDANAALPKPLTLDFEMNDPADLEQVYYRSDHYSYAAKGIPIIFFTTGLHSDYHRVSDTADKITYEKMARIGQLVYEIGRRVATLDHAPARDNKGPRAGKGPGGKLTATDQR